MQPNSESYGSDPRSGAGAAAYRERLTVPASWWALGTLFALSCGVAVGFYLGPVSGVGIGLAAGAVVAAVFFAAAVLVELDETELRVGRAVLEIGYIGGCRPLDRAQTSDRSGRGADARAYLVLRPYVPTAVEVTLDDAADPVPYWLISSRRPQQLAAAVDRARLDRLGR